jgi:hypothetical protein
VEYILGFGAAAVIVLTIIIVLILYLILQCRSQRRKRRAARAAGLHCDSNSGSYMERTTVDFIVPGEMELTSAVRSVSCNSTINKCNGNMGGTALVTTKSEKDGGCGSGNDGDDEEDYGGITMKNIYNNTINWAGHPPNGFIHQQGLPMQAHQQPPGYRHPPPYRGANVLCPCCGEVQQQQQQWYPQPQHRQVVHHQGGLTGFPLSSQQHQVIGQPVGIPLSSRPPPPMGTAVVKMCPRSSSMGFRPSFRQPSPQNVMMTAQGQFFGQQVHGFPIQRPPFLIQQPFGTQQQQLHHGGWATTTAVPSSMSGILKNQQAWMDGPNLSTESSICDNEDVKYAGAYSDGEAEKSHPTRRTNRSRSLPRRPASSMMYHQVQPLNGQPPQYVTLSRAALVEAGDNMNNIHRLQQFEQQSIQFGQGHRPSVQIQKTGLKYSSQPQLNGSAVLDFPASMNKPPTGPRPVPAPFKPQIRPFKKNNLLQSNKPTPKYQQPVSQQGLEDSEYLFPDLPPPPDAMLDNGSPSQDLHNSRASSLDDLQWVTSAAELSRHHPGVGDDDPANLGFHTNHNAYKSNTLPNQPSNGSRPPPGIMKKRQQSIDQTAPPTSYNSSARRNSGAIRVDLSSADKTIRRRPGSETDLIPSAAESSTKMAANNSSPMRSSMRLQNPAEQPIQRQLPPPKRSSSHDRSHQRHSGVSQGSSSSKKVMFSGVSDGESPTQSNDDEDDVWVLREDDAPTKCQQPADPMDDGIPVTGVVIAMPQPCQYVVAQAHPLMVPAALVSQQQQQPAKISLASVRPPAPPPPLRTTPVNTGASVASQSNFTTPPPGAATRPTAPNPVLQRPVGLQQFHESPDEGYHEDDAGSEVL